MNSEIQSEKKVLVVENDLFFSSKMTDTLKQMGLKTVLSCNSKEITGLLKENQVGLIILDLSVDGINTLSLIQRLKNDNSTARIPIIAFAEHTQKKLLEGAANAGCEIVVNNRQAVQNLENLVEVGLAEAAETEEARGNSSENL